MSRRRHFLCDHCGYRARVFGGVSYGFEVVLATIVCRDCKRLYDALADEGLGDVAGVLRNGEKPELRGLGCPVGEEHEVGLWESGDGCPECDRPLEPGEGA